MNEGNIYGRNILKDEIFKEKLSEESYKKYKDVLDNKIPLDKTLAQDIAHVAKDWAIGKGATHYSKWFQPLTGVTAEKQTSFLNISEDGKCLYEFPSSELLYGEDTDASSFPNGGLREIFEARGKIKWDYTFPMFIKEDANGMVLCIPTLLSSIKGESLDKRTPLLNSCKALSDNMLRVIRLFGDNKTKSINTMVGIEQEYFLIKKEYVNARDDLLFTDRTLIGRKKTNSVEKHYMSLIKEDVGCFMKKVEEELWKLGILTNIKHNEAAMNQHEIVLKYEKIELASNHDFLVKDILHREAEKMGFVCILSEKPFIGMNGSGKHNNWSFSTDLGENLLTYGDTAVKNAQFLTVLTAIISGFDKHADLIRATVATANNDIRLSSGEEAPSTIISIHLGDVLTNIIDDLIHKDEIELGKTKMDFSNLMVSDRNRTSPFAFIGNRFEFRMLGASDSIAVCNTVLNAILAEQFDYIANILENSTDFYKDLTGLLKDLLSKHYRIIYNGNSYCNEWKNEAKRRGLKNIETAPEAFEAFITKSAMELFIKYNIYSEIEIVSRYRVKMDKFIKKVNEEILIFIEMADKQLIPACLKYTDFLAEGIIKKQSLKSSVYVDTILLQNISVEIDGVYDEIRNLETALNKNTDIEDTKNKADYYANILRPLMNIARLKAEKLEEMLSKEYLPYPGYSQIFK